MLDNSWLLFTLLQTTSQTFLANGFHLEQPCAAQPPPGCAGVPASRGVSPSRPSHPPFSPAAVTGRTGARTASGLPDPREGTGVDLRGWKAPLMWGARGTRCRDTQPFCTSPAGGQQGFLALVQHQPWAASQQDHASVSASHGPALWVWEGLLARGCARSEFSFNSAGARRALQRSQHGGKTPAWPGQVGAKLGLTGPAGSSRICAKTLGCFCTMEVDEPGTVARRGCCRAGETASSLQLAQRSANEA